MEIYFNSFETDKANSMKAMFKNCSNLENLDLSNFNTSKVTNMAQMFKGCYKLKEIKGIEKFNTNNVNNMKEMFNLYTNLESLDLSNCIISNTTNIEYIFVGCYKLKKVKGIEKFNKPKVNQIFI